MKRDNIWLNWKNLFKILKGKKIFLFGRGEEWLSKALTHLKQYNDITILDNNSTYHNTFYKSFYVTSPKVLTKVDKKKYYIV